MVILSGIQESKKYGADNSSNNSNTGQQNLSALFNQKQDESIASVPEFKELMEEPAIYAFLDKRKQHVQLCAYAWAYKICRSF